LRIDYQRDDINRRVVVTLSGPYSREKALHVLELLRIENVGSYGILYDLVDLYGGPTTEDLNAFIDLEFALLGNPRGRIAVLAFDSAIYAASCTYAAMGYGRLQIEVFRDRAEAKDWLCSEK
jgi:hypothetical protein